MTLDDKLSASGTFALTKTTAGRRHLLRLLPGRAARRGRPPHRLAGPGHGLRAQRRPIGRAAHHRPEPESAARSSRRSSPASFVPRRSATTARATSGRSTTIPQAAGGRGQFTFTLRGDAHKPGEFSKADLPESHKEEARRRFPNTTTFTVDLPDGYRKQGTTFDHFGLMNMMKPGGSMSDLLRRPALPRPQPRTSRRTRSGTPPATAPRTRRRTSAGRTTSVSAPRNHAGGKAGEVGGTFWRSGKYAYYADKVGPLTLDDRLEASGKVVLKVGAPGLGHVPRLVQQRQQGRSRRPRPGISSASTSAGRRGSATTSTPRLRPPRGPRAQAAAGPVLTPGKVYDWSLVYDPAAEGGNGAITVTLGKESVTLALKKGIKAQGARFDRFGVVHVEHRRANRADLPGRLEIHRRPALTRPPGVRTRPPAVPGRVVDEQ